MAGKRIDIMDIKQLITLKKQGVSNRQVAKLLHVSRNTVNDYTQLLEGLQYSYEGLLELEDVVLKDLCTPRTEVSQERYEQLAEHFDYFLAELKNRVVRFLLCGTGMVKNIPVATDTRSLQDTIIYGPISTG